MSKRDLDRYFPRNGPCMFHTTLYARHRLVNALQSRHRAGDSIAALARDYDLSHPAVRAAVNSRSTDNCMTKKEIAAHKKNA